MDRSIGRILLALAICLALTATVSADTIIANWTGQTRTSSGGVSYNLNSGVGGFTGTTAGYFNFVDTYDAITNPYADHFPAGDPLAAGASILAFCIQLDQFIGNTSNPVTFSVVDLKDGRLPPPAIGDPAAKRIDALFTLAFTNGEITTPTTNADYWVQAVQVAIWEIVYESNATLGLGSGVARFTTSNASVATQADTWLSTINGINVNTYQNQHILYSMQNDVNQDFVIQVAGSPDIVVPEPGTMAMVGLALLGLGIVRRRMAN